MGTISKQIADDIIAGKYAGDGVTKIVTYRNMFNGGLTYAAVTRREDQMRYENSPACDDVRVYWQAGK